jgi:hypothetical protein
MVLRYLTLELYTSHSELNEVGEMERWRLADILQYSLMNCLLNVCVRARENNGDALGENSSLLSVLQPHEILARRLNGPVRSQCFAAVCVCVCACVRVYFLCRFSLQVSSEVPGIEDLQFYFLFLQEHIKDIGITLEHKYTRSHTSTHIMHITRLRLAYPLRSRGY